MKISIIIPNWNGKTLLEKNLPSVLKAADNFSLDTEIIIVDDASTDDSVDFLEKNYPRIQIIKKEVNEGFSSSINLGVDNAKGDIVVLLNSDTRPEENFLAPLIGHFNNKDVFAVGCLDKSYEGDKVIERGRGLGKFEKGIIIHSKGEVKEGISFWASGGSSAFDRTKWLSLGGLDRLLDPFYGEDLDLGFRAWKAGYKVLFEPKSIINHYHEQGTIIKNFSKKYTLQITFRNQLIFVWKNIASRKMLITHFLYLPYHLIRPLLNGNTIMLNGFFKALRKLPEILKHRKLVLGQFIKNDEEIFNIFINEK